MLYTRTYSGNMVIYTWTLGSYISTDTDMFFVAFTSLIWVYLTAVIRWWLKENLRVPQLVLKTETVYNIYFNMHLVEKILRPKS